MHFTNSTPQVILYSIEHLFSFFRARRTCPLRHCGACGDWCALIRILHKILNSVFEHKFRNFRPFSVNMDSPGGSTVDMCELTSLWLSSSLA